MHNNAYRPSGYYYAPKSDHKKKLILLFGGIIFILTIYWFTSTVGTKKIQLLPIDYQKGRCPVNMNGIEQISWAPRLYIYRDFLNRDELNYFLHLSSSFEKNGFPKTKEDLSHLKRNDIKINEIIPTNQTTQLIMNIEYKLAMWSLLPIEYGENFQYMKITPNDSPIPPHFDFITDQYPSDIQRDGGQRILTILIILSEAEGGELSFPDANIKIQVKKGDAILYYNKLMNGETDKSSAHLFTPVISGELRVLTKYYRENLHPYNFYYQLIQFGQQN